jgi:hypothetical protein
LWFDFKIDYRPGKADGKANALTHQGQESEEDSDLQEVYHTQTLLKSHNLGLLVHILPLDGGPTFHDLLQTVYETDSFPSEILQIFQDTIHYSKESSLGKCEEWNKWLYYCEKLFLPNYPPLDLHILQYY